MAVHKLRTRSRQDRTERLPAKNRPSGAAADAEQPASRVSLPGPTTSNSSPPPDLASALEQCRYAARRGYEIAKENLRESARAIGDVSTSLAQCLKKLEDGSVRTPGIVDQLKTQLFGVANELERLQRTSDFALEERRQPSMSRMTCCSSCGSQIVHLTRDG